MPTIAKPEQRHPPIGNGNASEKVNRGSDHTRSGRYGHPDKVLAARTPWVARLRVMADVEARQA